MKRIYIVLTACLAMVACQKNNVSFTYSPDAPRAGQIVTFTNNSSSGEDWSWSFGDGGVSSLKSPSHAYKKPGTYDVVLKVDNKTAWTATAKVTVYDTLPTFICSDTLLAIYKDYTFTAQVYNPYNYDVEYLWYQPTDMANQLPYCIITDTTMENSTLHLYFTRPVNALIGLRVVLNGDTTIIKQAFDVKDRTTNSLLIRNEDGDWRQRIFGSRAEDAFLDASATEKLDAEQDTFQIYNRDTFYLSEMQTIFPELLGFHIAKRKFYYRDDEGLWIANIDGSYNVPIDTLPCSAMTLDMTDNRIYWANENGVWYMPFVGSDNNQFITTPVQLNNFGTVSRLATDGEKK